MSSINLNTAMIFNNLLKSAENIVNHMDEKDKRNDCLTALKKIAEKHCQKDEKLKLILSTVKELSNSVNTQTSPDEVLQSFKDKKKEFLELTPDASQHTNYVDFCSQVDSLVKDVDGTNEVVDDDFEVTQDVVNLIDPFTKKRMTDPVKNKACNHVYDRESVEEILKMNAHTRCPVIGCKNRQPILLENMVADILTRKHLNKPAAAN